MDGYIQNALFGQANMAQVDARLDTFHTDWQAMKKDFAAKAEYLKVKVGLDIKGDWSKLTGIRTAMVASATPMYCMRLVLSMVLVSTVCESFVMVLMSASTTLLSLVFVFSHKILARFGHSVI